jgi:hypothetical protein
MFNIAEAEGGRPVFFVRFNPDAYEPAAGQKQWSTRQRHDYLAKHLRSALETCPVTTFDGQFVYIIRLFFDGWERGGALDSWRALERESKAASSDQRAWNTGSSAQTQDGAKQLELASSSCAAT